MTLHSGRLLFLRKCLACFFTLLLCLSGGLPLSVLPVLAQGLSYGQPAPELTNEQKRDQQIDLTVSESKPDKQAQLQPISSEAKVPVETEPVSASRLEQIAASLPPLTKDAIKQFKLATTGPVKPQVATTQTLSSLTKTQNAPTKPQTSKVGPLKVTRVSDQGKLSTVSQLAITFNQPMIALKGAETVSPADYLSIEPKPEGTYRWLGDKTILFTPARGRLPRATHYTVTIPTTTKSIYGQSLDKPYVFSIDTPPVTPLAIVKSQDKARTTTPLIVATFDQDIDRQAILKLLTLTQANNQNNKIGLRLVADAIALSDKSLKDVLSQHSKDQWLAFEPVNALPKATSFVVKFASGLPSKEGPLKSQKAISFGFSTYGPLKLISQPVPNTSPESWNSQVFEFSNTIAESSFDAKLIKIQPTAPDLKIEQQDSRISITGDLKALTTYTVTFDKTLTDEYGQKLGTNLVTRFTTGKREPAVEQRDQLVTLPKFASPVFSIKAQGIPQIKITVRNVKPAYWCEYANIPEPKYKTKIKGQIVETKVVSVGQNKKTIEINLAPHLTRGYGHLIVTAESLGTKPDQAQGTATWVQVTNLGADVTSGNTLTTLVTNLSDGKFVQGATVQLLPTMSTATTGEDGLARLLAPDKTVDRQAVLISKGDDTSITANRNYQSWLKTQIPLSLKWYLVTDRNLYKPGETVNFKGYCRLVSIGKRDEFIHQLPAIPKLAYKITDGTGIEIAQGECKISEGGAFNFNAKLPDKVNLGSANVVLQALPKADSQISKAKKNLVSGFEEISQVEIKTQDGQTIAPYSTQTSSSFMIQEFRAPEFEMKVKSSGGSILNLQESTDLVASTKYFAGGTLTETPVNWQISATPSTFSPVGWSEYRFGINQNIWSRGIPAPSEARTTSSLTTHTGADGQSTISVKVDKASEGQPTSLTCKAEVLDLNRQSWSDSTTILVHPSDYYVGLKSSQNYYHSDKPLDYQLIVTDKDGKAKADCPVNLKLMMSQQDEPDKLIEEQTLQSTATPLSFNYKPQPGGEYKIIATVSDSKGHKSKTSITTWVQGKQQETFTTVQSQTVEVMPSKTSYQPGEKAEVIIFSPFYPAQGTLTVRRMSVVQSIPLTIDANATTVEVPVSSDYYSDFDVHVQLAGKSAVYGEGSSKITVKPLEHKLKVVAATPQTEYAPSADSVIDIALSDASGKPVANGEVAIAVVDESILALSGYNWGDPLDAFYPEGSGNLYDIHNRETVILPMPTETSITPPGPRRVRYYDRNPWQRAGLGGALVNPRYGQSNEVGQAADAMAALPPPSAVPPPPLAKEEGGRLQFAPSQASPLPAIAMRTNLASLALFEPSIITDQNGKASVKLHLPDNLTSYRIMALAASGSNKFGTAESSLTARLPLSIKPSAPRFLNFGDSCELPLMVYNQSNETLKTEVVLQASNAKLAEKADKSDNVNVYSANDVHTAAKLVEIKAHDRVEVRFAMTTEDIGKIKLQCAAIAQDKSDATYFEIPVQTPATTESTAAYGQIDGEPNTQVISQKLEIPADTYDQVGGLSVTTSSTAMQNLLDSYIYLRDYQFDCSEQLSSRIIATLSLQNVLSAFGKLDDRDNALIRTQIQKDVDQLLGRQKDNGGFGLWSRDDRQSWPYVTLQTIEALNLARTRDYKVDSDKLFMANNLLRDFSSEIPTNYDYQSKLALQARVLQIRSQLKDNDPKAARLLIASAMKRAQPKGQPMPTLSATSVDQVRQALTIETAAWLLEVVGNDKNSTIEADLLRRYINSEIVETASTASLKSTGYGAYNYCMFYSNHRAEAVLLQALIKDKADNPIISKLAKGLLNSRKNGLWNGPQENHVILKALQKYFATYENKSPDFVVRLWLNDVFAGEDTYKGRSAASKTIEVPLSYLKQNKVTDLTLSKAGAGRLYYRLALDYAPRQAVLKPADFGFVVERTYEGVQNKDDAKKDQSGIWHFKAGALIRSKIKFTASGSRYHVALLDPMPAGAEAVNSELSGTVVLDAPAREEKYPALTDSDEDSDANPAGKMPASTPAMEPTDTVQPWWQWPWFEHQNLRDQQAEAFTSELYAGDYTYSYLMRATTPGTFIVPPTKVLEMYETETFGRAASDNVIVE